MTGQAYRRALGRAAQAIRVERGYRSVAALVRTGRVSEAVVRRVEGSKEPAKDLQLATIEAYAGALGVDLGALFSRADDLFFETKPNTGLDPDERAALIDAIDGPGAAGEVLGWGRPKPDLSSFEGADIAARDEEDGD